MINRHRITRSFCFAISTGYAGRLGYVAKKAPAVFAGAEVRP